MSSSITKESEIDDALQRLARSVVGKQEDEASLNQHVLLAKHILSSSVLEESQSSSFSSSMDSNRNRGLSATWNRIERLAGRSTRKEVQELHEKLKQVVSHQVADQAVTVLSKLVRTNKIHSSSNRYPAASASRATNSMRDVTSSVDQVEKPSGDRLLLAKQVEREETLVLRECLYALQGMDGERIRHYWANKSSTAQESKVVEEGIRIRPNPLLESVALDPNVPSRLGSGSQDALRLCGEAAWFHHRIQTYIVNNSGKQSNGIVSQALACALSTKLQKYYSLLSSMEADIATSGLTLRQLLVELQQPTLELRTLAMVTDGVGHLSGGQLLSALYQHSLHGDTRHAALVEYLVSCASQPWYHMLFRWTTQGELVDPHQEFFIQQDDSVDDEHLWHDRYTIRQDQIVPSGILDLEFVRPAWILGKGVNFIRKCLLDTEWKLDLGEHASRSDDTREALGFRHVIDSDNSRHSQGCLPMTLRRLGDQIHSHILNSVYKDHHLMEHLWGLKQFLFLGQGDFFSAFMEGMHAELGEKKGLAGIYRHSIMSIAEEAIRDTNARQLPPYVLERVQVKVVISKEDDAFYQFASPRDAKDQDMRSPWDVIELDYCVPNTLSAIVDDSSMKQYKQVFSLLFQLKRVEFVLNATWRQSTSLHHAMQTFAQHNAIAASTSAAYAHSLVLLRKISMVRQSMMHFVGNLKSYLFFEVLEGGWKVLALRIKAAKSLDEVIDAHRQYLTGVVRKSLLTSVTGSGATESEKILASRLHELLMIAKDFCEIQERLFSDALSAVERATEKRRVAEERMKQGKWGFSTEEDFHEEESFFGLTDVSISQDVDRILVGFTEKTKLLLEGLHNVVNGASSAPKIESMSPAATPTSQSKAKIRSTWTSVEPATDPDPFDHDSLRFLAFQLDFSSYYNDGKRQ